MNSACYEVRGCHGDILSGKKDVSAKIIAKHLTQSRFVITNITHRSCNPNANNIQYA